MNAQTAPAVAQKTATKTPDEFARFMAQPVASDAENAIYSPDMSNHLFKMATVLANSSLLPKHFQGQPANIFVGLQMAARMKIDAMMLLQNMQVINGKPGLSAVMQIALANKYGPFSCPILFRENLTGPNPSATAYATHKASGETVEFTVDMKMATAEGWTRNPKYASMPGVMLAYRAACFLIRRYCPEVTMGMQSSEEVEDAFQAGIAQLDKASLEAEAQRRANVPTFKGVPNATPVDSIDEEIAKKEAKEAEQGE